MTTEITIDAIEYRDRLDLETRNSIMYAFYLKGKLDPETLALIMGWKTPKQEIRDCGYME